MLNHIQRFESHLARLHSNQVGPRPITFKSPLIVRIIRPGLPQEVRITIRLRQVAFGSRQFMFRSHRVSFRVCRGHLSAKGLLHSCASHQTCISRVNVATSLLARRTVLDTLAEAHEHCSIHSQERRLYSQPNRPAEYGHQL